MKHCEKCNVDIEHNLTNCPLCGAYLKDDDGDRSQNIYAYREVNDRAKSRRIVFKTMLFASIIASIVCLIIDLTVNNKLVWSMHLVTAIVGFWLVIAIPMFFKIKIRRQLCIDMFVAIAVVFYAEGFARTTSNWGFLLGLPIVIISTFGLFALVMMIDHRRWQMYAMTVTPINILSIIPMIVSIFVFKDNPWRWAWYVTAGLSVIMLFSFFIFGKQDYIGELRKRLHF